MLSWANPNSLRADTCDSLECGDANGDGYFNITDLVALIHFLYRGGSTLGPCVDFDGNDLVTFHDHVFGVRAIFAGIGSPSCVEQPKLIATPTNEMSIRYESIVQQGDSLAILRIHFSNRSDFRILDFSLPLLVRVAGVNPISMFVDTSNSTLPSLSSIHIDTTTGTIQFVFLDFPVTPGDYILCDLIVRVEPSLIVRHVTLEYTELGPYMTGVFEPPNSACNYVMFLDDSLNAWQPELVPTCMCGDADNNGLWTVSDAVYIIYHIFGNTNPLAQPCLGDANGSGGVSISDAIYLIVYILGGPPPHCP